MAGFDGVRSRPGAMDRQGGRWGRRAGHSAGQPPCFDAGRKIGEGGAEATPLAATPGAELDAAQVAEQDATQGAEQDRLLPAESMGPGLHRLGEEMAAQEETGKTQMAQPLD